MFGLLPEPAARLVSSVIESAAIAGFQVTGVAVKNTSEPIQMKWETGSRRRDFSPVNTQRIARDSIRELLSETGEPTAYIKVHTATLCALAQENAFPATIQQLTRRYSKRQETWFKREPGFRKIPVGRDEDAGTTASRILELFPGIRDRQ